MLLAILTLVTICIAFLSGLTGIGGGVLYLPLLIFLGYHIWEAASISIFISLFTSLGATIILIRRLGISQTRFYFLEIVSLVGAFAGGYYCVYLDMDTLFLIYLVYSLITVLLYRSLLLGKGIVLVNNNLYKTYISPGITNFVTGVLFGLIAVSGSFIKIPALYRQFQIPYIKAMALSGLSVIIISLGALLGRLQNITFDLDMALFCSLLVIFPSALGAYIALKTSRALVINSTVVVQNIIILANLALAIKFIAININRVF